VLPVQLGEGDVERAEDSVRRRYAFGSRTTCGYAPEQVICFHIIPFACKHSANAIIEVIWDSGCRKGGPYAFKCCKM
jgi:hypothetical protein